MSYLTGLIGMWIFTDGIISIRLYLHTQDETGKRVQSWKYDHSIRILRCLCGVILMVIGATICY